MKLARLPAATASLGPIQLLEVETSEPLGPIEPRMSGADVPYTSALCLVRLHGTPLGLVPLALGPDGLGAGACARDIWRLLGGEINAHLRADGLPAATRLTPAGLAASSAPGCLGRRADLLADAPTISVVIATRDRPETLRRCLESVLVADYPSPFEVFVVDNASTSDATADLVAQLQGRGATRVRYYRENRPGPSWARNRGLSEATSELVVFLDDDVVADRRLLAELSAGFRLTTGVGCVTGLILPAELETPAQVLTEEFGGYAKGFDPRIFDVAAHRPDEPLYPFTAGRFGAGACMAFRASLLRAQGGFDPALGSGSRPTGGEELAAFLHVVRGGHRLVYAPSAIVRHAHHREYDRLRRQVHGYGVGLGAYLTRCVAHEPSLLVEFARKLPRALWYLLAPGSVKNERKSIAYPRELTITELIGLLRGPLAYVRGRTLARDIARA
jgi:glycosyltransferase involved in cell wall biosynthesis